MAKTLLSLAASVALLAQQVTSAPVSAPHVKRQSDWSSWQCDSSNIETRVSFQSMAPEDRKAYTDAINCIHSQPSSLDPNLYSAAVNRYQDYAVVHVNRTSQVHLDGFFLVWHRMFLQIFENDMRQTCGYQGAFPYWDFSATVNNLQTSTVFDGSEYSMGSDGAPSGDAPIALGPTLVVPHGTGGGCIKSGPFSDWTATLAYIDPLLLVNGSPLPPTAYNYNASCLYRDLNTYVAQTWTTYEEVANATHQPSAQALELAFNGVIGGSSLGVHSAAHFTVGGFMDSIHVSVQDPIWWAVHANVDRIYASWQANNPDIADEVYGTMTANNAPPSANVTLNSIVPDFGYFDLSSYQIQDLISTTAGPFCYTYDQLIL